jgi:hypothetical protein
VDTVVVAPTLAELGRVAEAAGRAFHERTVLSLPGRAPPA